MAALLVAHGRPGFYLRVLGEAGDEILRVASGPERMSVFEINALLYMPGHPRSQLERALRIPALSAGWRGSLEALLAQERSGGATTGNAGLTQASGPPPAWPGFRPLRVSRKVRESVQLLARRQSDPAETGARGTCDVRAPAGVSERRGVACRGVRPPHAPPNGEFPAGLQPRRARQHRLQFHPLRGTGRSARRPGSR
jgi:3-alpha domain